MKLKVPPHEEQHVGEEESSGKNIKMEKNIIQDDLNSPGNFIISLAFY